MKKAKDQTRIKTIRKVLADGTIKLYHYEVSKTKADPVRTSKFPHGSIGSVIAELRGSSGYISLAKRTKENYTLFLRRWEDIAASSPIDQVKRRQILALRDRIFRESGPGAAVVFTDVTSALFKFALLHNYVEANPCRELPPIQLGSLPAWTKQDAALALEKFPAYLARVVLLGMFTGQRRGDLVKMLWADIDRRIPGTIYVKQEKAGTLDPVELDVPIHPTLMAALTEWKQAVPRGETILLNSEGRPFNVDQLSSRIGEEMAALRPGKNLNVHGLRKLAAANLATAGCTTQEIMAITGHKTLKMVEHYTRTADRERLAKTAMEKYGNQN